MAYLLDSNVFIEAKRRHYGMDFCPAFWDWLIERNRTGEVFSIEQVADELEEGGDDLSAWAAERGTSLFLPADEALLAAFPKLTALGTHAELPPGCGDGVPPGHRLPPGGLRVGPRSRSGHA